MGEPRPCQSIAGSSVSPRRSASNRPFRAERIRWLDHLIAAPSSLAVGARRALSPALLPLDIRDGSGLP
jgi:hypothetical protein